MPRILNHPHYLLALVALVAVATPAASMAANTLSVGTCAVDITPVTPSLTDEYQAMFGTPATVNHTDPVYMAGFGNNRQATGYNDRLWARGIVVDGRGGRIALVALDVVGYFNNEVDTIRAMVAPTAGIDYLVVHSTHQHEGPDTVGIWGPDEITSGIDFGYLDFVNAAVADCVEQAAAALTPARVRFATVNAEGLSLGLDAEDDGFGVGDGKVLDGDERKAPATEGRIVNPNIGVMQFTLRPQPYEVVATLVNFASHPESLGSGNTLITSDFPHYVRERLEAQYGGLAIWVSGDLGVLQGPLDIDVTDPVTGAPAPRRTFRFAQVHGEQLADRAISGIDPATPGSLLAGVGFASTAPVPLQLDNPYFRLLIATGALNPRRGLFTDGLPDDSIGFPYPGPFAEIPQALGEDLHTEVGAFRIGRGSFAVVPGELDPQIGDKYRRRMVGAGHRFIVGLGNDEIGYQVPRAKWDNSCHACAPFVIAGLPELCPIQPIDCSTVFQNNVGRMVDPTITDAMLPLLDELHLP